jgi:hypothetical protein
MRDSRDGPCRPGSIVDVVPAGGEEQEREVVKALTSFLRRTRV